jgi:hypothetical protein
VQFEPFLAQTLRDLARPPARGHPSSDARPPAGRPPPPQEQEWRRSSLSVPAVAIAVAPLTAAFRPPGVVCPTPARYAVAPGGIAGQEEITDRCRTGVRVAEQGAASLRCERSAEAARLEFCGKRVVSAPGAAQERKAGVSACIPPGGRRLLSLEEVVAAGRPAAFSCYGDYLAYVDATVYSLPREPEPHDLAQPLALPGAYVVTGSIGIEFGWHHLDGCDCAICADASKQPAGASAGSRAAPVSTG